MSNPGFSKEELRSRIADWLVSKEKWFDSRCKLTFVMRAPHLPDGDLIVTSDNIDAVIVALQRLRGYEEIKHPEAVAVPPETPRPDLRALIEKWRHDANDAYPFARSPRDSERVAWEIASRLVRCADELAAVLSVDSVPPAPKPEESRS